MGAQTAETGPRLIDGGRSGAVVDARVSAVLEVLAGSSPTAVARRWSIDSALLHRWVRDFVEAGTAQVTNMPLPDAARQRDRFLTVFAHELRTPLAVAQGWVSLLHGGEVPSEHVTDALGSLHVALDRISERTVDVELLVASALGRVRCVPERVPVGSLTQQLPGLEGIDGEGAGFPVSVDPALFFRVLRDVWDAAATAPEPARRRLEVVGIGSWTELRIVREGPPLDTTVLQALFEPFDRAVEDSADVTIGLYLARALTVVHGGMLGVEQDDDAATFWIRIPDRPVH